MNKKELKERFIQNEEILRRLSVMLEDSKTKEDYEYSTIDIEKAIETVKNEQLEIDMILNKHFYEANKVFEDLNLDKKNKIDEEDPFKDVDLITNNEEEKLAEDIDYSASEDVTEVLTSDKMVRNKFFDARIVFDGIYRLFVNDKEIYSEPYNDILLLDSANNSSIKNNLNIIKVLKTFDAENNSDLCSRYLDKQMNVTYYLDDLKYITNNKEIIDSIKKVAKKEAKNNDKVTVNYTDTVKKVKSVFVNQLENIKSKKNYEHSMESNLKYLKRHSKKRKPNVRLINAARKSDTKVIFDGVYKVIVDNEKKYYEPINNELLNKSVSEKSKLNLNIVDILNKYDKLHNTNLCDMYFNKEIDVIYDFDRFEDYNMSKDVNKKLEKVARREARNNDKVYLSRKERMRKIKYTISALAAAMLLTIGGINLKKNNNNSRSDISIAGVNIESSKSKNDETAKLSTVKAASTEEEIKSKVPVVEEKKEEKKVKTETPVETKASKEDKMVETLVETKENDLKIGDVISLDNADLYYSSTDETPAGNTDEVGNYEYKASLISVIYKGTVVDVVCTDSVSLSELEKACKEKYNGDVKLSINFDLVDENGNVVSNYVGWVNSDDVKTKSKVLMK